MEASLTLIDAEGLQGAGVDKLTVRIEIRVLILVAGDFSEYYNIKLNKMSTKEIKISDNKFDFGQFYFSYAKYHYNDTNKWIHVVFIPTIVFTLIGMLHYGKVFGTFDFLSLTF